MKMDKVAGSGNDNFYTPPYGYQAYLGICPPQLTVWCPFEQTAISSIWNLMKNYFEIAKERIDKAIGAR